MFNTACYCNLKIVLMCWKFMFNAVGVPQMRLHHLRCERQGPRLHRGDRKGHFLFFYDFLVIWFLDSVSDPDPDPCGSVLKMAPLDPDPDPYWQYGSGSRTVKMVSKKEKKLIFQVKKSNDHFVEGLMVFNRAWESSINVFTAICDWKQYFNFSKKKFLIFWPWKTWIESGSGFLLT